MLGSDERKTDVFVFISCSVCKAIKLTSFPYYVCVSVCVCVCVQSLGVPDSL